MGNTGPSTLAEAFTLTTENDRIGESGRGKNITTFSSLTAKSLMGDSSSSDELFFEI